MIDEYGLVSLMDYHLKWQGVPRYSWTKQQKEQQADWTDGKRTEQNISVRKHCFDGNVHPVNHCSTVDHKNKTKCCHYVAAKGTVWNCTQIWKDHCDFYQMSSLWHIQIINHVVMFLCVLTSAACTFLWPIKDIMFIWQH